MKIYVLSLLVCASALSSPLSKQYRSDYEYNRKADAFYKLHVEFRIPSLAKRICEIEGASLMKLTSPADVQQVHTMLKRFPDIGRFAIVATDGQRHDSLEEEAMINIQQEPVQTANCEVVTREGDAELIPCWQTAPFLCKVDARDAYYDEECGVYAKGYVSKISTTGSCYRIPQVEYTWNEAYAECVAEGAHLVVLNTEGEHQVVTELIQNVADVYTRSTFFFAGIRADRPRNKAPRVFRTVLNQTLEEAGYAAWSPNEPNNHEDNEFCGTLFRNDGNYNDLSCAEECRFVCEKERKIV